MSLVDHLERFLGPIVEGWGGGNESSIRVVRFSDQPERGVSTYVTVGLSNATLPMLGARTVREELLVSAHDRFPREHVASFLMTFADYILSQQRALLRGDVVGPADALVPDATTTAVYASIPVLLPDGLATYEESTPPTVVIWLIPLPRSEALWIKAQGWNAYEAVLEGSDVDFFDLNRPPIGEACQ